MNLEKNLKNIPEKQQQEIKIISEKISKIKKVEKIILFGSFARGDFVLEDFSMEDGTLRSYKSDYDILVILSFFDKKIKSEIDETLAEIKKELHISRPVTVVVESRSHVNKMLEENRYFYADIIKEGIMLFDDGKHKLSSAKILTPQEKKEIQKEDFKLWFPSGEVFLKSFRGMFKDCDFNEAAFMLHQTTEKFITAYLLVKTGYRPKTHDLLELYENIQELDDKFKNWFDFQDDLEKNNFELLRKAYVDARYSKNYKINKSELEFLEKKVIFLKDLVEKLCEEEIKK